MRDESKDAREALLSAIKTLADKVKYGNSDSERSAEMVVSLAAAYRDVCVGDRGRSAPTERPMGGTA